MKSIRPLRSAPVLTTAPALAAVAGAQTIARTVDADKAGPPISPLLYGYFTVLLGNRYEGGP